MVAHFHVPSHAHTPKHVKIDGAEELRLRSQEQRLLKNVRDDDPPIVASPF
jgi:hypothetical protein